MQESPFYEYVLERGRQIGLELAREPGLELVIERSIAQGIEQGTKATIIESIVLLLDTRFEVDAAETLKPVLEAIDDLACLKHLLQCLIRALRQIPHRP